MSILFSYILFNIINVIVQTVKSIATIRCGKGTAAIVNAIAYGLYTYIIILTTCDLSLWIKIITVGGANLVGVWVVKYFEEKGRKDKLWKIEIAIPREHASVTRSALTKNEIPHNYTSVGKWIMFNCYCATQKDSHNAVQIAKKYKGKISAYESKPLNMGD